MTRPKVAPEQRQRTAQACESCKRRKQKLQLGIVWTPLQDLVPEIRISSQDLLYAP
ncbi:hypothetical protein EJ04DRAFT_509386 [Polyplosphaeria fusca]|uniref:Uncharacterized protein n=1 Tax=Polyplosphaeria fusca TaxID=682080 RepID=A0A9P4R3W3_9PLEO|nr:hypothetical protein EJ04DRAFT_509386 [Polyplosphaeria fusca]